MADLAALLADELRRIDPQMSACDIRGRRLAEVVARWSTTPDQEEVPEHSCEWCDAGNYNHPGCPENAEELKDVCPSCGGDPEDVTGHADGCERLESCGQFGPPWLGAPWHPLPKGPLSGWLAWHRENTHGERQ